MIMAFITTTLLDRFAKGFAEKISGLFLKKTDIADWAKAAVKPTYTASEVGANNYVHPTTSGNRHIPSGGKEGQVLRWGSDGTAVWGADSDTQYAQMKGAGASAAGTAGLAPAPPAGTANRYLRSDGTWAVPPDTAPEEATTADIDQIIAGTFTS